MNLLANAGGHDLRWRRFLIPWLGLSFFLILVAAFRSEGFHQADEHFQTIEFMAAKLGLTPLSDLPWEFRARMRAFLQPGLYYVFALQWERLGVRDRFTWVLGFRLLSGALAWLGIVGLSLCTYRWFDKEEPRRWAVRLLCLAWFVPYLAVRTSSESLSGSCFLLGLSLLVLGRPEAPSAGATVPPAILAAAGLFFGLAFQFRYAVGVMALAVAAWVVIVDGLRWWRLVWMAAGVFPTVVLGAFVDRWGYGDWVWPAVQYAGLNLGQGLAAEWFGAMPWYGYFLLPLLSPMAPLVLVLLGAALLAWFRHPRHVLTWASLPLFIVHSSIAHKEFRFLFPIATLAPVLLVLALAPGAPGAAGMRPLRARPVVWLGRALLAFNLVGLAACCLLPPRLDVDFQKFIYHRFPGGFEAYLSTFSPYSRSGLPMHFYQPERLNLINVRAAGEIERSGPAAFWVITGGFDDPAALERRYSCQTAYRSLPEWVPDWNWFDWQARAPTWKLYHCRPRSAAPAASG